MFLKIAFLNIRKHAKRSTLVFVSVMVAVAIMCLVNAVLRTVGATLADNLLPSSGHVQLKKQGYKDSANPYDLGNLIPAGDSRLVDAGDPRVLKTEKVLSFGAVLLESTNADEQKPVKNLTLLGYGVEENSVFFENISSRITRGAFLPGGRGIVLSEKTAGLLGLKLGEGVVVLTQDTGGNPWYQEFPLVGLFTTGNDQLDENGFYVSHGSAEELLDAAGLTREIRVRLKNADDSEAFLAGHASALKENGLQGETWQALFGSILAVVKMLDIMNLIIDSFFVIVAASVITNTILMSVFDRIREFGTMRAIGIRRKKIFGLILQEGAMLGLAGAAAGVVVGFLAVLYFHANGIDLGSLTEYMGFENLLKPNLDVSAFLLAGTGGLLIALGASLYAARVSSRLSVLESLTHN